MHTPEPWKINHDDSTEEWSIVTNQHGSIVANVNEETGPELAGSIPVMRKMPGMENARRIVACVNACRGLPTDELEQKGLVAAVGTQLLAADDRAEGQEREIRRLAHVAANAENELADALNQRDELLAALEGMMALDEEHHQRYPGDEDVCLEVMTARAAIASAKA